MASSSDNRIYSVCVTVNVQKSGSTNTSTVVNNRITQFPEQTTFKLFLNELIEKLNLGQELLDRRGLNIKVSTLHEKTFEVNENDVLGTAMQFADIKFIRYHAIIKEDSPKPDPPKKDAFVVLMSSSQKPLDPLPESNQKNKLHNAVLGDLQEHGPIRNQHFTQQDGSSVLQKVTNALWYLDGRQKIIEDCVNARGSAITAIPSRFKKYVGFQNWKEWKKKPRIDQSSCHEFAESLLSTLQRKAIKWPEGWAEDIISLASTFSTYAQYLKSSNENQQQRQCQLTPIRELSKYASAQYRSPVAPEKVHKNFKMLSELMEQQTDYEPVLINNEHFPSPLDSSQKYYFLNNIALAVPVQHIRYDAGGGTSVMHFLYKVPLSLSGDERMTSAMRILKKIEPQIPVYHTRAMRKMFQEEVTSLHNANIPPHVLRHIYRRLTGDSSAETVCESIDERIKVAIETGDPDLILDLRHLNQGRPGDTFETFFEELEKLVEEKTAADERRHGIAHMSEFLSIRDLIEQVKEKVPEGSPIPSESTVIYSFSPPNTHSQTSQYYTGRIKLKHAVQSRQLRAFHQDAHYCNALFRYLREMSILHQENSLFLSCDDKAKIDFGEPGLAMSSGVRGKQSIIPTTSFLGALDHDMEQKGSLTPSVTLNCDIPENIDESFYRGQVSVCLKDSVFQPSSSFRSTLELLNTVKEANIEEGSVKNVFMITDGSPEHRVTFDSVKIPLILLFRELNLDMLVAIRTAPGHSYTNPVERVMSILNIGFQNVALQRESTQSDATIKKCRNIQDLRNHPEIRENWRESLQPMLTVLENRVERLALKGVPFKVTKAASDEEVQDFVAKSAEIDENLPILHKAGKLTKANLASKRSYQQFLEQHCQQGVYSFQIRRCDNEECCPGEPLPGNLHWLPHPKPDVNNPGHYMDFATLYGKDNTGSEDYIPSKLNATGKVTAEQQGCKASTLTAQNVRAVTRCTNCQKPRCIYAEKKQTPRESRELASVLRKYDYTCGCMITPDVSLLSGVVFTRLDITCESPLEWAYYGATKVNTQTDLCAHCGGKGASPDRELKKVFKTVLPICATCQINGKQCLKRGPLPGAKRAGNQMQSKAKKGKHT